MLGYTIGAGAKWDGEERIDPELEARYELRMSAFTKAIDVCREHTTKDTWNEIVDILEPELERLKRKYLSNTPLSKVGDEIIDTFLKKIEYMDENVYWNLLSTYKEICYQLEK